MAIYHHSVKVHSRSGGRSATACAAYRAAESIRDERTGEVFDYSRKTGVEHREIITPDGAPDWAKDRGTLWNKSEQAEKRKDAQVCREFELSLPRELTPEQRAELVREWVKENLSKEGIIADATIHNPSATDGTEQPHAHVLTTMRDLKGDGFGNKNRDWNAKDKLEKWRETWAEKVNEHLERAGHRERVDHRTLEAQKAEHEQRAADQSRPENERNEAAQKAEILGREPQPKVGVTATAMERKGIQTERGDMLRAVEARNQERQSLREQLRAAKEQAQRWVERQAETAKEAARNMVGAALEKRRQLAEKLRAAGAQLMAADKREAMAEKLRAAGEKLRAEDRAAAEARAKEKARQEQAERDRQREAERQRNAARERGPVCR